MAEKKQRVALGSVVIESTERFPNPEKDFWEGEQWEVHLHLLYLKYFLVLGADQPVDEALLYIFFLLDNADTVAVPAWGMSSLNNA